MKHKTMKLRLIIAIIISLLPLNFLRVFCYKAFLGYVIQKSRIGWGTVIAVKNCDCQSSNIGPKNKFIGPLSLLMRQSSIGSENKFLCGLWTLKKEFEDAQYDRTLILRKKSFISDGHYFDLAGSIVLDEGAWIAGYGSQFWTHGAGVCERNIRIGKKSYIGSGVLFAPGSSVADKTLVSLGSVVVKKHSSKSTLIGGNPAKILRRNYQMKHQ